MLATVLWIRDILLWIRICGSEPLTGFGPWIRILFLPVAFKMPTKNKLFFPLSFYSYYFLKVHLHPSSKIKSHKEFTEQ
jgi:hypothetical protein